MPRFRYSKPDAPRRQPTWLLSALDELNDILQTLGLVGAGWTVGRISLRELPAMMPVVIETTPSPPRGREGSTLLLNVHDGFPTPVEGFAPSLEEFATAVALTTAAKHGDQPFLRAFDFVHSAYAERLTGNATRAVIELNTAVEVLLSALLTELAVIAGWTVEKIEKITGEEVAFRNRLMHHLGPLLGEVIEPSDAATAWGAWFSTGYEMRNAAVHRGVAASRADAIAAFAAASALLDRIQSLLDAKPKHQVLRAQLSFSMGSTPPWEQGVVPVVFPWEDGTLKKVLRRISRWAIRLTRRRRGNHIGSL